MINRMITKSYKRLNNNNLIGNLIKPRQSIIYNFSINKSSNRFFTTNNNSSEINNTQQKPTTTTTTLRKDEIDFFNEQSQDWWNSEGTMKPLHRMNPFRVNYICDRLKIYNEKVANNPIHLPLQGLNVIDIGCGAGLLTESLSRLGASKVVGLDAAKNNILMAISHASFDQKLNENIENKSLQYIESTIENFSIENNQQFDAVCSLEVIEHVDNPKQFLEYLTKIVKPGGSIFLSTINKTFLSYISAILGAEYIFRMVPVGTHHWNQFIKPEDLKSYLKSNNCETTDLQGLVYNPLLCEWDFTNDLNVNYILHAIKK
ncbi:hypothetical protein RB653_004337 [Dictyostelium firmibasis]|uniref:Ubiquinone biosynthesis O-methyltransferase, mitochondrial n=1 Tax=Dictyostelium firmibasis TaxID=79012 RepID=A0AAN7YWZ3_9MYCE